MSRSRSSRALAASLVLALFTSGCLYNSPSRHLKETRLELGHARSQPIASRVDVELRDNKLHLVAQPMCAPIKTGTYTIIEEDRATNKITLGQSIASMAFGTASLIGGYFAAGTAANLLAYELIPFGIGMFTYGFITFVVPRVKRNEHPHETFNASAADLTAQWEPCGSRGTMKAHVDIKIQGGGGTAVEVTDTVESSEQYVADLGAWAAACGGDVRVTVALHYRGDDAPIAPSAAVLLQRHEKLATLADRDDMHAGSAIARRFRSQVGENAHVEIGEQAGKIESYYTEDTSWSFTVKPAASTTARPGTMAAHAVAHCHAKKAELAAKQKQEARDRCMAPKRPAAREQCKASCVFPDKTLRCETKRDICLESTAGIEGEMSRGCRDQYRGCLISEGQTPEGIAQCLTSCENAAVEKQCP